MARYTDESRERVRDAVDFAEIVGARTELKRAGVARLQGLCPFHEERTPSFGINPAEKVYYCFGCGAGGDVFKFVMETEGLDFGAALESLAERYRVPLERETEDPRDAAERERQRAPVRAAGAHGGVLRARAVGAPTRPRPRASTSRRAGWRRTRCARTASAGRRTPGTACFNGSRRAGYTNDELLAAGLIQTSRGGSGFIDRFRGRITFPLADERGRVLGFGARAMKPDQQPKYLNTSDGPIFHKGRIVYGADLARAAAAKAGRVVLVEGYTDVIALHQAGVPEVVAQMGTALTEAQITAIAKLAPKALFCQDPDRAGQESVARGIAALRGVNSERTTRGVEFRIVRLPAGQDPADVVQRSGAEAMRALLDERRADRALRGRARARAAGREHRRDARAPRRSDRADGRRACCAHELVKLVADRLGLGEQLVNERAAGGRQPRRSAPPWERPATTAAGAAAGDGGAARGGGPRPRSAITLRHRPSRSTRARRWPAASRARRRSSPTASRCPTRASGGSLKSTSTTTSPRPRRARPPRTCAAACAPRPPTSRRATTTLARLIAKLVVHVGRARGDAGEARARGAPTRPPPPRTPHLERPHHRRDRRHGTRRRAPKSARRDPPPADCNSVRHTN